MAWMVVLCGTAMPLVEDAVTETQEAVADTLVTEGDIADIIANAPNDSIAMILATEHLKHTPLAPPDTSLHIYASKKELKAATDPVRPKFIPNPQRALWLALLVPGAGQIYNRKYWKLPIVYGGFLGCVYAFTWNQQMYLDYSQAYLDIMDDDPNTNSFVEMLPKRYDIESNMDRLKRLFKKKKDYYRRYRDLSAFCFAGVYLLSVIDAYVDAQLSEFNISDDLSMRVSPAIMDDGLLNRSHSYGLGCSLNF